MSRLLTRRTLVTAGVTGAGASRAAVAVYFADRYGLTAPDRNSLLGNADLCVAASSSVGSGGTTQATRRLATPPNSFARFVPP